MKKIITHNARFHADDVSAVAVLSMVFNGEIEVTRTRDKSIIATGDIVLDVGGKYDGERFFDHHQVDAGLMRGNGVPYAAFGLIWKRFGRDVIAGDVATKDIVFEKFDKIFVQPIDAIDNGVPVSQSLLEGLREFSSSSMVYAFYPTWHECSEALLFSRFMEAVAVQKQIITRILGGLIAECDAATLVKAAYERASDKRIIELSEEMPFQEVLMTYPEPLYVIYKNANDPNWHLSCVRADLGTFKNRRDLPASWGGKRDAELEQVTGVRGSVFAHKAHFMAVADSHEGALALARLALAS